MSHKDLDGKIIQWWYFHLGGVKVHSVGGNSCSVLQIQPTILGWRGYRPQRRTQYFCFPKAIISSNNCYSKCSSINPQISVASSHPSSKIFLQKKEATAEILTCSKFRDDLTMGCPAPVDISSVQLQHIRFRKHQGIEAERLLRARGPGCLLLYSVFQT